MITKRGRGMLISSYLDKTKKDKAIMGHFKVVDEYETESEADFAFSYMNNGRKTDRKCRVIKSVAPIINGVFKNLTGYENIWFPLVYDDDIENWAISYDGKHYQHYYEGEESIDPFVRRIIYDYTYGDCKGNGVYNDHFKEQMEESRIKYYTNRDIALMKDITPDTWELKL